ncbi:MAG: phytanoyl-CoA dioxygenase family protein [Flavobacteriales bacterium]|nr:phytanoyl-CoA dioxygenase family protein [Flavobacteriales bacterium]
MQIILSDPDLNRQLAEEGYVIVPWLTPEEVNALRNAYHRSGDGEQKNAFTTFACSDEAYRTGVDASIKDAFSRSFNGFFTDYRPFWGNFFTKPAGAEAMPLHADLQYVDEPEHISLNIWCPLVDTTEENGAFGVVPRSHLVTNQLRGVRLPQYYAHHADDIRDRCGTVLQMKAGEAVIYDHRLLHYSLPNRSSHQRLAATLVAVPTEADVVHYFAEAEGSPFEEYRLNDVNDLLRTPFFTRLAHLTPVRTLTDHPFHEISAEDVGRVQSAALDAGPLFKAMAQKASLRLNNRVHRIFRDGTQGERYVRDGYTMVPALIDATTVAELTAFYRQEYTTRSGMYVTHFTSDLQKNRRVSDRIFELIAKPLNGVLRSFRPIISHYAVKAPGEDNHFDMHQDWGIVDEDRFGVAHVWVALTDVGPENGGLTLVPRSHLAINRFRSGTIPIRFLPLGSLEEQVQQFRLKAGDAIIYHPGVFHGSPANAGSADRLAVIAAVCDERAGLSFFHGNGSTVEVYPLSEDDVFSRLPQLAGGVRPSGNPVSILPGANTHRSDAELLEMLRNLTGTTPADISEPC